MRSHVRLATACCASLTALLGACDAGESAGFPTALQEGADTRLAYAVPAPTAGIQVGSGVASIFPYLTNDISSTPQDPVNLVFVGEADPLAIRATLMALDGNRGGSPLAAFDCTWKDAIGGLQAAWAASSGWTGSVIQLECGDYGPVRFHLRLFDAGDFTIGGAHFEFLIPGTSDHQVVSWELAEQLVTFDLARAGVLGAAPASTGPLNATPSFRTIPAILYQLATAADPAFAFLLGQLGLVDLPSGDKGIPTDGMATVLTLAAGAAPVPGIATQDFEVPFGQLIPKPFCLEGAPSPYLYVSGAVRLTLESRLRAGGSFAQAMRATGRLTLTPWNPVTNQPAGAPYEAQVSETQDVSLGQRGPAIFGVQQQHEIPTGAPGRGRLQIALKVDSRGVPQYERSLQCHGAKN